MILEFKVSFRLKRFEVLTENLVIKGGGLQETISFS